MFEPSSSSNRHLLFALFFSLLVHGLALTGDFFRPRLATPVGPLHAELRKSTEPEVETAPSFIAPAPIQRQLQRRLPQQAAVTTNPAPEVREAIASAAEQPIATNAKPPENAPPPQPAKYTPPSRNAAYLDDPRPIYPSAARRRNQEGLVIIDVLVGINGLALQTRTKASSGTTDLDTAAAEAVSRWHFHPAQRGAEAVEAWISIPIRFRLEDAL